jgi:orotidine-5'-phosphate decarboxylase
MFEILKMAKLDSKLIWAARQQHHYIQEIASNFKGLTGEKFVRKFLKAFSVTGAPIFINLDHNVSGRSLHEARKVVRELEAIVTSTAGLVWGYKLNFQSLLTFLVTGKADFVDRIKSLYSENCELNYGVKIEPVVWLDQKLGDIPSTNFQAADILYKLGFDAIHVLPQIGPDSVGAVQLAADKNKKAGVIHVINLTHKGYEYVKNEYFGDAKVLQKLRENALGKLRYFVEIEAGRENVPIKAVGVIEPANRPYELYEGYVSTYDKKCMIISIGIGPQGALPGCALYAGATCEGIGRFIFKGVYGIDSQANITRKTELSRQCALLALFARFKGEPYPVQSILEILKDHNPRIDEKTMSDLKRVFMKIKG